ncbi:MAG TPA: hypothetical protein VLW06_12510 [Terriglobales bacterium]|nr:hypothetical protein [Terriglobales bacterium]
MSGIKRLMEAVEEKRGKAKDIARRAGVLKVCEYHHETFASGKDVVEAYKLAAAQFKKGSIQRFVPKPAGIDRLRQSGS